VKVADSVCFPALSVVPAAGV
jgi:hypothetical protein